MRLFWVLWVSSYTKPGTKNNFYVLINMKSNIFVYWMCVVGFFFTGWKHNCWMNLKKKNFGRILIRMAVSTWIFDLNKIVTDSICMYNVGSFKWNRLENWIRIAVGSRLITYCVINKQTIPLYEPKHFEQNNQ